MTGKTTCRIGSLDISPPLLLAPMAGITHSAFRRLVASFGGYGALSTEMIPTAQVASENLRNSPLLKRRDEEGIVVYQIVVTGTESIVPAIKKLTSLAPAAIDLNLGCPAPMIARKGGGCALFDDYDRLQRHLDELRSIWDGPLTVKIRLGHEKDGWQEIFSQRLDLFRSMRIDALTVHPRFFHEKLKRKARWHLFPWIRSLWRQTLIGNGDITDGTALRSIANSSCDGIMIGRAAARMPWIFSHLTGVKNSIDYWKTWSDLYTYTIEDFPSEKVISRLKEFTACFAENFFFGHELFRISRVATTPEMLYDTVGRFLQASPRVTNCSI